MRVYHYGFFFYVSNFILQLTLKTCTHRRDKQKKAGGKEKTRPRNAFAGASQAYLLKGRPRLSVKLPQAVRIISTSQPMPNKPPVKKYRIPMPILPT